eukprot:5315297-Pyramimonas_sp.AAC.1
MLRVYSVGSNVLMRPWLALAAMACMRSSLRDSVPWLFTVGARVCRDLLQPHEHPSDALEFQQQLVGLLQHSSALE